MQTLKNDPPKLQPVEPAGSFGEAEPDNAHVAFAIVFLATLVLFGGGLVWFLFR